MAKNNLTMDDLGGYPDGFDDMMAEVAAEEGELSEEDMLAMFEAGLPHDHTEFAKLFEDTKQKNEIWGRAYQQLADKALDEGYLTMEDAQRMQDELNATAKPGVMFGMKGYGPEELAVPLFTPMKERNLYDEGLFPVPNPGFYFGDPNMSECDPREVVHAADGKALYSQDEAVFDKNSPQRVYLEHAMELCRDWHQQTVQYNYDAPDQVREDYEHGFAKRGIEATVDSYKDGNGELCVPLFHTMEKYKDEFDYAVDEHYGLLPDQMEGIKPTEIAQRVLASGRMMSDSAREAVGYWATQNAAYAKASMETESYEVSQAVDEGMAEPSAYESSRRHETGSYVTLDEIQDELAEADRLINDEGKMSKCDVPKDMRLCVVDKGSAEGLAQYGLAACNPNYGYSQGNYWMGTSLKDESRVFQGVHDELDFNLAMDTRWTMKDRTAASIYVESHLENAATTKKLDGEVFHISWPEGDHTQEELMVFRDVAEAQRLACEPSNHKYMSETLVNERASLALNEAGYDKWHKDVYFQEYLDGMKERHGRRADMISYDASRTMPKQTEPVKSPEYWRQQEASARKEAKMPELQAQGGDDGLSLY